MSTVAWRKSIRDALIDKGFRRVSATRDKGDGVYGEHWADDEQNQVVISWAPRTEPRKSTAFERPPGGVYKLPPGALED